MEQTVQIGDDFINANTHYPDLIDALRKGFSTSDIIVPMRHHHYFPNPEVGSDSTLLLMPAWHPSQTAGVKIATVSPENDRFGLPSIQATYLLLDALKGTVKAILQAKSLTAKRTAAASALASSFLSKSDSSKLLMIGTGALSTNLIQAHASVRPIQKVFIWGRNNEKAQTICDSLKSQDFSCEAISKIEDVISDVDIVSCATLSKTPLVFGKYLKPGQHIDLVGSYKKDMREADDELISKASIYLDTYQGGLKETGDIVIPLQTGTLLESEIKADLFQLCAGKASGRIEKDEITVFKSVGHALEDLVAANYYYELFTNQNL